MSRYGSEQIDVATTVEVLQEFAHVRARRRPRFDAIAIAREFADGLRLIAATRDDLDLGLSLFGAHERLGAFDAILAAVALNHRVEALLSADRAFGSVPGLRWIDPASHEFTELLER